MLRLRSLSKDHFGCLVLLLIGAGALGLGLTYSFGSLNHMGPGFIPVVLGVMMMAVALAIGITATPRRDHDRVLRLRHREAKSPEWRGWICIVGGVVTFVVLGKYGGLVPASFALVFVSALGDRQNSVRTAGVLATLVTIFGVSLFYFGLHLQLPLFQWGG